jgi:cytoskeleton protein RodZ
MTEAAFAALASARQAAGLTLEEAARQLKFAPRQLEALEAGELRRLPGGTFVRGMVRSYARLLRIDPEPLLAQIAAQVPPPDAERLAQRYRQPVPFTDGARRSNLAYVALSLVLLVAVAAVALQWRQERAGTRTLAFVSATQMPAEPARADAAGAGAPSASVPSPAKVTPPGKPVPGGSTASKAPSGAASVSAPAAAVAPAPKTPASAPPAAKPQVSPAAKPQASPSAKPAAAAPTDSASAGTGRLALQFEGDSWVEIRSGSGKLLVASLHTAGTERFVSGLPPFEVVIGNAQQVRLTYNDKPVDLTPYVKVEVARFTLP